MFIKTKSAVVIGSISSWDVSKKLLTTNRYCCRGGIHFLSCPEPLPNKEIKVQVNKQKPSNACPAWLMLIAIKCPLIQRQAAIAAIPMLYAALLLVNIWSMENIEDQLHRLHILRQHFWCRKCICSCHYTC